MDTRRYVHLTIRLDVDASPVAGDVRYDDQDQSFVGWLELAIALESAIRDARRLPGGLDSTEPPGALDPEIT
jgi:hypothetical protein